VTFLQGGGSKHTLTPPTYFQRVKTPNPLKFYATVATGPKDTTQDAMEQAQ